MKKLALSIIILVLFAAVASATVPEAGKEAAAKETVAAETKISQPAAEAEDSQPSKPVYGAFAGQKAKGAGSTQELATTSRIEESAQQLAVVPQFMESAGPSEKKRSTDVEESAVEQETEYKEAEEKGISDPL